MRTLVDTNELEYSVIGALCQDADVLRAVAPYLRPEDFSIAACATVYETARDAHAQGKLFDAVIAAEALRDKHDDPRRFIADCMDSCPSTANAETYAELLRKHADERRLREAIHDALDSEEPDLAASIAGICAAQIRQRPMQRVHTMAQALYSTYEHLWDNRPRIDTGWGRLDRLLKGMQEGELILIGARPSVGKSAFGLSIAENAARFGSAVALFSLEMLVDEVAERIMARHTNAVTLDDLIDRGLSEAQGEEIVKGMLQVQGYPLTIIDTPGMTVSRIRAQALALPKLDMIVIDYIGLLRSERHFDSRYLELSEISRSLKNLAVELKIPIVALAQLNRARGDTERPTLRELRDSGCLEQDANKVLLLWNVDTEEQTVGCSVAKNRRGRTGVVQFTFDGAHMRFIQLSEAYEEPPRRLVWDGEAG